MCPAIPVHPLSWEELTWDLRLARRWTDQLYVHSLEGCVWNGYLTRLRSMDWTPASTPPETAAVAGLLRAGLRGVLRQRPSLADGWASGRHALVVRPPPRTCPPVARRLVLLAGGAPPADVRRRPRVVLPTGLPLSGNAKAAELGVGIVAVHPRLIAAAGVVVADRPLLQQPSLRTEHKGHRCRDPAVAHRRLGRVRLQWLPGDIVGQRPGREPLQLAQVAEEIALVEAAAGLVGHQNQREGAHLDARLAVAVLVAADDRDHRPNSERRLPQEPGRVGGEVLLGPIRQRSEAHT